MLPYSELNILELDLAMEKKMATCHQQRVFQLSGDIQGEDGDCRVVLQRGV